ncbi:DUF1059 domain-containing protein [Rhodococcus opacus]|nr:DUF1059 domain-containing protein [Rhodococcus opacus]
MTGERRRYVQCPCGELIEGRTDDLLVDEVQHHLREQHPHLRYSRDQILSMSY